jgi:hypothetical protein
MLFLKRPFDGLNLPLDTANPVEKSLLFLNRMTHRALRYPHGVYYCLQSTIGGRGIVSLVAAGCRRRLAKGTARGHSLR